MSRLLALMILAIGSAACGPRVPIVHQENAVWNSKLCFEVAGQEVRAYRVPCPDPHRYVGEYMMWMQRVATEWRRNPDRSWWQLWKRYRIPVDPKSQVWPTHMLQGLRVVFVNNWIQCGKVRRPGCTEANVNGKPTIFVDVTEKKLILQKRSPDGTPGGLFRVSAAFDITGHEWCHGVGFIQGIERLQAHQRIRVMDPHSSGWINEQTSEDVWTYIVCESSGKSRPRLKRSILKRRCSGKVGRRRCKRVTQMKYCQEHQPTPPVQKSGEIRYP